MDGASIPISDEGSRPPDGDDRIAVSVLVPVRNEATFISTMLGSMRAQTLEMPLEFLLLDGGSTDSTRELLEDAARADPRIRVIDNPGVTIPRGLNLGLGRARGRLVARMDAHAVYPDSYLSAGIARLDQGDVECVTGPAIPLGTNRVSRCVSLALGTWAGTGGAAFRTSLREEREVDRGFGGVWRRTKLMELGGWDESSPVNEDAELAARLRAAGGRIVCIPEMAARYVPRASLGSLARQYLRYGYYRARTASLHPTSISPSHLLPPAVTVAAATALLGRGAAGRAGRWATAAYAGAAALTSVRVAGRAGWGNARAVPLVFATMHLCWGVGYLAGAARFTLLRALGSGPSGGS